MDNGVTHEVIEQFDKISKLTDTWDHNQQYQSILLKHIKKGGIALDVGCGTGEFTRKLSKYAEKTIGIDVSGEMIKKAKELTIDASVEYYCIDLDSFFKQSKQKYDSIVCIAALHHMNEEESLKKMKEALTENGTLCILDLCKNETFSDYVISMFAAVINPIFMLIKRGRLRVTKEERDAWKDHFQYDEYKTIKEMKDILKRVLGGGKIKKHLFWRYSIIYHNQEKQH